MMAYALSVLVLIGTTWLVYPACAGEIASGECPRTFEFTTPEDWRCEHASAPNCTICRNRSLHHTDLVVRCTRDDTREHVPMPPGGGMTICSGQES